MGWEHWQSCVQPAHQERVVSTLPRDSGHLVTDVAAASANAAAATTAVVMLQVCGLLGVLGRVPLQQHTLLVPAAGAGGSSQPVDRSSSAGSFPNSDPAAAVDDAGASRRCQT